MLFEQFGSVESVDVLKNKYTGESRGFGFVTMDKTNALAAMTALGTPVLAGRAIRISEAKPIPFGSRTRTFNHGDDHGRKN